MTDFTYAPADVWDFTTAHASDGPPQLIRINGVEYRLVDSASTVVLDPESEADVDSVADAIRAHHKPSRLQVEVDWLAVQAALRSLLPVATPPEPNGLGAVVLPADSSQILLLQEGGWHIVMPVGGDVPTTYKADARDRVLSHGLRCTCGALDCNGGDQ